MLERWLITSNWTQEQWLIFSIIAFVVVARDEAGAALAATKGPRTAGSAPEGLEMDFGDKGNPARP